MERVLVTGAAKIGQAGVATIVYKWGQQFDSQVCVYDYLMQSGLPDDEYVAAIAKKGGRVYTMDGPRTIPGILAWITSIVRENHYRTLHINSDSAYIAAAYIHAAKRGGIERVFVHSHCTQIDDSSPLRRFVKTALHQLCMPYVRRNTELYLACSALAGQWMFGRRMGDSGKYRLIHNGVEAERYAFDREARAAYRQAWGVGERTVLGHIGRFSYQKNHDYLIDIFLEYRKRHRGSLLVLVGTGELLDAVREKVKRYHMEDSVLFLGLRDDVPALLSAMDVLVMPSRFEGLPVTMVEAQMASLPCVVSDAVTREADFTGRTAYVPLGDTAAWVSALEKAGTWPRPIDEAILRESPFHIKNAAETLQRILTGPAEKRKNGDSYV